jgi:hypothetical protein
MEQYIQFPSLKDRRQKLAMIRQKYPDAALDASCVPALFVVNGSLPLESPSMMSPSSNGPTLSTVFYFAIKISTIESIESIVAGRKGDDGAASSDGGGGGDVMGPREAAIRLLQRFCAEADTNDKVFSRFKCIGMV